MTAIEQAAPPGPSSPCVGHPARLVIGYGNPLRADDGLGWQVAQQLAAVLPTDDVAVLAVHQLTPELAEAISQAQFVVFVDAREGCPTGEIDCRHVVPSSGPPLTFSHDIDPPALLGLARFLYGTIPTGIVVSVTGGDFGYGTALSQEVQAALPAVIERVRAILDQCDNEISMMRRRSPPPPDPLPRTRERGRRFK